MEGFIDGAVLDISNGLHEATIVLKGVLTALGEMQADSGGRYPPAKETNHLFATLTSILEQLATAILPGLQHDIGEMQRIMDAEDAADC